MTRHSSEKGRNIYFVSDSLKQIVTLNQDRIKFINMGIRLLTRTDLRDGKDKRTLRLSQEGIAIIKKYFTKRRIELEESDVLTLLAHASPSFPTLSESVRKQINELSDELGSLVCTFTIERKNSSSTLRVPIAFVAWRGRNSLRPFLSHSTRKFYLALCNVDQTTINAMIDALTIEEKFLDQKKDTNQNDDDNDEPVIDVAAIL